MQANRYSTPLILLAGLLLAATQAHAISLPLSSATPPIGLSSSGNSYAEVGDAGDRFNPQDVTGTGISQITGTIGPDFLPVSLDTSIALNGVDLVDAFRFFFAGGDIQFDGWVTVGDLLLPLDLTTFIPSDPHVPGNPVIPSQSGLGMIGFSGLAAGNYLLEASFNAFDPPFTITLTNPATGGPQTVSAPVPEPGSLALLGLGLAALAARRRRQPA